jgi:hypothetical protein
MRTPLTATVPPQQLPQVAGHEMRVISRTGHRKPVVRIGGKVIERLAVIARNAGWRYIEIASKVERHRSVQDATPRLDVGIPVGRPNLL